MEEYEKNIARIEKEYAMHHSCDLIERMAVVETRLDAADRALTLAEGKVSRAALISVITSILAVLAIAVQVLKH